MGESRVSVVSGFESASWQLPAIWSFRNYRPAIPEQKLPYCQDRKYPTRPVYKDPEKRDTSSSQFLNQQLGSGVVRLWAQGIDRRSVEYRGLNNWNRVLGPIIIL